MSNYTPTSREMPPVNEPIEWITPGGSIVKGRYAGGVIWFPEGSPMYVYYTPTYWRLAPPPQARTVSGDRRG